VGVSQSADDGIVDLHKNTSFT